MRLTFVGADHEVTGSCHYLEAAGKKILVDYGMEQGRNVWENVPLPAKAADIDYVFVTHAHIDHTGLLPLLGAQGFHGKIFATRATTDLCEIMLLDSAGIQEFEAEWRNRKGKRKGEAPYVPIYTSEDATRIMKYFVPCPYNMEIDVCDGIRIRFTDVGHLLGSAAIEVWLTEEGKTKKIVFSGDIGNTNQPLIRDPETITDADYLVTESTYGDRSHGPRTDYVRDLAEVIQRTFDRGGNIVIPSFAVGRTQEMLYFIRQIKEQHLIQNHDGFDVYVDSPLAVRATSVFNENARECFDEEAESLINQGINPISFPGLKLATTPDESKNINFVEEPKVIISASGMCDAGRIKHHLKHNLWREESTILFVGYQSEGTLGRRLLEGVKEVTLFGEEIHVAAEICALPGISGHADQQGLLNWAAGFTGTPPRRVFVVHGEDSVVDIYAGLLHERLGYSAVAPYSGTVWNLLTDKCEFEAKPVPYVKRDANGNPVRETESGGMSTPYRRLENTAERLLAFVHEARGFTNKDLAKYTDQLTALLNKWEGIGSSGRDKNSRRDQETCGR